MRESTGLADLEAVLFDAGGTLIRLDYAFIARRAADKGAHVMPAAFARAEVASRVQIDRYAREQGGIAGSDAQRFRSYFETLLRAAGLAESLVGGLVRELEASHGEDNLWCVPVDGALETLRDLRARGLRTAVVSNADGRLQRLLEATGLAPHIDLALDSQLEGVEKPDPAIFQRALERLGVPAERTVYVGDIYSIDAVGARAAGMAAVILDSTGAYDGFDCLTIGRLEQVLDWFA
jgi:putative hydrolase of the HAD superfamily